MLDFLSILVIFLIAFIVIASVTAVCGVMCTLRKKTENQLAMSWLLACFGFAICITTFIKIYVIG